MPEVITILSDDDHHDHVHPPPPHHHQSSHVRATSRAAKKRKRAVGEAQPPPHKPHTIQHHPELLRLRANVEDSQAIVKQLHNQLTDATAQLQRHEQHLAERLNFLRRQADAQFNWLSSFPWNHLLSHQMRHVFNITTFRPLQREALNATLLRRDVFAILPTGAGKSLIYQLAAVVDTGLTLVVTPLLSLSQDQRASLRRLSIQAESLDSTTNKTTIKKIYAELLPARGQLPTSTHPRKGRMQNNAVKWVRDDMPPAILFVTPEQLVKSKRLMARLEALHEMGHLSRICIDEAHCVSSWGHDFRSEYRKLGLLRRHLPDAPLLALSATCSTDTTDDVSRLLEMRDHVVFRGSVDRPNLFYEVRPKASDDSGVVDDLVTWIRGEFEGKCGIVYVLARKDADNYSFGLQQAGIEAGCYHGDLEREQRNAVHEGWADGTVQVVVATIAFGLGIDNPRVRFVIHATMATSMEAYYQESGRAGRDGAPATCILLHRARDLSRMSAFVADKGADRVQKVYEMYAYASSRQLNTSCRRTRIATAFNEVPPLRSEQARASCCDICRARTGASDPRVVVDVTALARDVASMLRDAATRRPDDRITILAVATDWSVRGARGERLRQGRAPIDRRIDIDTRVEIIAELVMLDVLREYHRHSSYAVNAYITIGDNIAWAFGGPAMHVTVRSEAAKSLVAAGCSIVERACEAREPQEEVDDEVV